MIERNWMAEARQIAGQCWCDPETKHMEMNSVLAEAFAKRLAHWMQKSSQHAHNEEYYRDIVERCGISLDKEA